MSAQALRDYNTEKIQIKAQVQLQLLRVVTIWKIRLDEIIQKYNTD